jgi:hypothetical protein
MGTFGPRESGAPRRVDRGRDVARPSQKTAQRPFRIDGGGPSYGPSQHACRLVGRDCVALSRATRKCAGASEAFVIARQSTSEAGSRATAGSCRPGRPMSVATGTLSQKPPGWAPGRPPTTEVLRHGKKSHSRRAADSQRRGLPHSYSDGASSSSSAAERSMARVRSDTSRRRRRSSASRLCTRCSAKAQRTSSDPALAPRSCAAVP